MNNSADEILQIINKKISSSHGNIFQLRKDFERLYSKFNSNQALHVKKQKIEIIDSFKISAGDVSDNYIILFFHGGFLPWVLPGII